MLKMVDPRKADRLVSALEKSILSLNQGPRVPRDVSEIVSACSCGECTFRGAEGLAEQRNCFVPPKDLRKKRKTWSLLKNRCGIRDTSHVFATHVAEGPNEHGIQKDALVPWWYWKATLKTCSVHRRDGFILVISSVRATTLNS